MTDHKSDHSAANKKRLADERAAHEKKQAAQQTAMAGVKPTPTQEENDLTASGEHVSEHEADGSPPDPNVPQPPEPPPPEGGATSRTRQVEAGQRSSYSTRGAAAAPE